jgi:hypothetical protein
MKDTRAEKAVLDRLLDLKNLSDELARLEESRREISAKKAQLEARIVLTLAPEQHRKLEQGTSNTFRNGESFFVVNAAKIMRVRWSFSLQRERESASAKVVSTSVQMDFIEAMACPTLPGDLAPEKVG